MARIYPIQPAHRDVFRAALKHAKKKAKAAVTTNQHLELTQGSTEAQELEGYCEEVLMVLEAAVGAEAELTRGQVMASRSALRVYGGDLQKKEDGVLDLLGEDHPGRLQEVVDTTDTVAALLRVLSPQTELDLDAEQAASPPPEPGTGLVVLEDADYEIVDDEGAGETDGEAVEDQRALSSGA